MTLLEFWLSLERASDTDTAIRHLADLEILVDLNIHINLQILVDLQVVRTVVKPRKDLLP